MYFLPVAIIVGAILPIAYISAKKIFPKLVRKKASKKLESILFPDGYWQKSEVLKTFRKFTSDRFSDEEILDYFFKIKGLQTIKINSGTNFWIRKYLFSPTTIKLNYFEQVKFYETFLNFPEPSEQKEGVIYRQNRKHVNKIKYEHAAEISKNII
ncbi:hypothetical protein [Marinilabilia rubra]|uniref:Uncharacterized protein n=1 Tax=Marinilabilia rubra TaxID=2162893 RepID=A0A2U2B7X7_9BACT|nr:hypothetical protein [Marinilabilia rubra]PWD99168.1 hypothetical protein DDZ16_11255 [Marinilabilia rubra]